MNAFLNWLDHRTGYRAALNETLYEPVPGGARWRYVFGSMLVFAFVTQLITGLFLWMFYSAGAQNAWESVYYIQYEVQGGWLLRGVHHTMAQAMVVLLPLHLLQVILCGAYKPPREINYWLGLVLMMIVLALGLTGYLLPWDQKGYWATKVATELTALAPGGKVLQKLVVGGDQYGHATLTRFFALHAGLLPALLIFFLWLHITLFRRHGVTAPEARGREDQFFWPRQVLYDAAACAVLMAVVLGCVIWEGGAELGPPAEPTQSFGAARPEWYFLFLFQLLKKFQNEFVGAILVPSGIMLFLFLMPFLGRVRVGHVVNIVVILVLIGGAGYLTGEAIYQDNYANWVTTEPTDPEKKELHASRVAASKDYFAAREAAHQDFERVKQLIAERGIPRAGVASLLADDPGVQGPRLFARACQSCHSHVSPDGEGIVAPEVSAPNLYSIGTLAWWKKVLSADEKTGFTSPEMFGQTALNEGDMASFVQDDMPALDDEQQAKLEQLMKALVAQAKLPAAAGSDGSEVMTDQQIADGLALVEETWDSYACSDCHKLGEIGDLGAAPDLTDIYSYEWLTGIISNPEGERFYPDTNDRMPAFAAHPETPEQNELTAKQIDLLVRWLRGER